MLKSIYIKGCHYGILSLLGIFMAFIFLAMGEPYREEVIWEDTIWVVYFCDTMTVFFLLVSVVYCLLSFINLTKYYNINKKISKIELYE